MVGGRDAGEDLVIHHGPDGLPYAWEIEQTGKSERIVNYTADEVREQIARGEDRSRRMDRGEALRRRRADEAPRPCPGWEVTITVELPQPKQQITLRLDADMLGWFRAQGRG